MRMLRALFLVLLVSVLFIPSSARAQTGDLQVNAESGIRIYIDDRLMGVTNNTEEGLFLEGLEPGEHELRAVRTGEKPMQMYVDIVEDVAVEVLIDFSEATNEAGETTATPRETPLPVPKPRTNVGTFVLSSDPVGARIFIDGEYKGDADIVVDNREAGRHTIVFQLGKQKLTGTYSLRAREVLKLKANFLYEDIVNLTEKERTRRSNRPVTFPRR